MRIAEFKRALFGIVNYGLLWLEMMDNPVLSVSKELFQMFRKVIK
jgi:hypothetical protein